MTTQQSICKDGQQVRIITNGEQSTAGSDDSGSPAHNVRRSSSDAHPARSRHESEWVAQLLETIGHEWSWPIRITRRCTARDSRRVKTDRRDVVALAGGCRLGLYRQVHRRSPENWAVQWHLTVREQLGCGAHPRHRLIRCLARMGGVHIAMASRRKHLSTS